PETVVVPVYVLPAARASVNVPDPLLTKAPAPLNRPLKVVELLFPPVVRPPLTVTFPPAAPPPASDPIVSVPLIVKATPAAFASVIADESPQAPPPLSTTVPPLILKLPTNVPGPVPAAVAVVNCNCPLPILLNVALGVLPITGPPHVKEKLCVSNV